MNTPKRPRIILGYFVGLLVLGAVALTACDPTLGLSPQEVQAFNSLHRTNISVDAATQLCRQIDIDRGPGSCQAVVNAINAAKLAQSSRPGATDKPYRSFSDCGQAVDYLFAGRSDLARAKRIVWRESRNNPTVSDYLSGTHKGCAQLSSGLRAAYLRGPWNDAYYNVLAMRTIVDTASGSWRHWD